MAEHSDLVAELAAVEKMTTQERLKHAKKRRTTQLKKFSQYEKALDKEHNKKRKSHAKGGKGLPKQQREQKVHFVNNIMLLESAARNDIEEVRNLLMLGVDPDVTNEDGLTALHQCCIDDLDEMMRLLISFNANVNARDSELWTPLHAAATCGHVHLCKFLIDHGAELLGVNADGNMAYDICEDGMTLDFIENEMAKRGVTQELIDETRLSTERKMLEDLQDLAAHGESLEFIGRNGETPLHIAAANGYIQVAEYLISQQVALDCRDADSWQPVHAAACWGHLPILELLVHHGADIDAQTKTGETPFDICEDLELKQRIMEMKDELAASRRTPTKGSLKRRKSQNTRSGGNISGSAPSLYNSTTSLSDKSPHSASIRRTSMREKSQLSWKEAREEATRLRGSTGSDYGDDDDEQTQNGHHMPNTNEYGETLPVSNIDDVQVTLPPEPQPTQPVVQPKEVTNGPTVTAPAITTNSSHGSVDSVSRPARQPATATITTTNNSGSLSGNGTSSSSSIPRGSSQSIEQRDSPSAASKGVPMPPETTSAGARSNVAPQGAPPAQPPPAPQTQAGGVSTLADLKRQRQQKLQDSLRFKDSNTVNKEIQSYNANHAENRSNGRTDNSDSSLSNGRNASIPNRDVTFGSNTGDPPKKKYSMTSEVVGGSDTSTSCCTIL